jgi:hypothetical protein
MSPGLSRSRATLWLPRAVAMPSLEELHEPITRRYGELTRSLDEHLGLKPAPETRLVYRQLLGQA